MAARRKRRKRKARAAPGGKTDRVSAAAGAETEPPEANVRGRPAAVRPEAADPAASTVRSAGPRRPLALWKKIVFATVFCGLFFLAAELLLALAGVRPVLYEHDPYVGFAAHIPLFVSAPGEDGREMMVTALNKRGFFNEQQFPRRKPAGSYRIFCLGGSTTYGRPYNDKTSFCGWLRALLPKADPAHGWEVVNAGGISYASYRVANVAEQLLEFEPDLFIIYCGQNEFLERRTYGPILSLPRSVVGLGGALSHTRIYTAVKYVVDAVRQKPAVPAADREILPAEVKTLLDDAVGPSAYQRDDAQREEVLQHYRYNLSRMVQAARSAGAAVVLVTPASNLRNCAPFKSQHRSDLADPERARWRQALAAAQQAAAAGHWGDALAAASAAVQIDKRYAYAHYLRGRALWELGRFAEAKPAFLQARDEDVCPLRALTPMRGIVAEVAAEQGVPLVDFVALIEKRAAHATPGDDLFLDHVHPTIEGNRLLALALLETLAREGIVHPRADWGEATIAEVTAAVEKTLDRKAHGIALKNLAKVLNWAGKFEEGRKAALRALAFIPNDAAAHYEASVSAARLGRRQEAIAEQRQVLRLAPGHNEARNSLGMVLLAEGKVDEAIGQFQNVLERDPTFVKSYVNLGLALELQGQVDRAIQMYHQALQLEPDFADAHNNLGNALRSQGKVDEAIGHYRQAIRVKVGAADEHYNLANALQTQGHVDQAIEHYCQALRIKPNLAPAHNNLAYVYQSQGRIEEAVRHYREALRIRPDFERARKNLAAVLAAGGRDKEPPAPAAEN